MDIDKIKRQVRKLKRLEIRVRFGHLTNPAPGRLLWNEFFSDKEPKPPGCRYGLQDLVNLSEAERKEIITDFVCTIYSRFFYEQGLLFDNPDPVQLQRLGLPPGAGPEAIKARFRELAKQYHPDVGGDHAQMVALLRQYRQLLGEEK